MDSDQNVALLNLQMDSTRKVMTIFDTTIGFLFSDGTVMATTIWVSYDLIAYIFALQHMVLM